MAGTAHAEENNGHTVLSQGDVIGEEALHRTGHYRRTIAAHTDKRVIVPAGSELRRLARKFPVLAARLEPLLEAAERTPSLEAQVKALQQENLMLRHALSDLALKL